VTPIYTRAFHAHAKNHIGSCCEPVGGTEDHGLTYNCGSNGYGFRFTDNSIRNRETQVEEAHELNTRAAALCVVAIVSFLAAYVQMGIFGQREMELKILLVGSGIAMCLTTVSLLLCRKFLNNGPIGWLRVSNVFTLYYICTTILRYEATGFFKSTQLTREQQRRWMEFSQYSVFALILFSQEKLLWKPEVCNLVPVITVCVMLRLRQLLDVSGAILTTLLCAFMFVLVCPQFSNPGQHNTGWVASSHRLFYSLTWPILAFPFVAAYREIRKGGVSYRSHVFLIVSLLVLICLAALLPESSSRFFQRTFHGKEGRFCCMQPTGEKRCSASGFLRSHYFEREPTTWPWEVWAVMLITVFTNASGIPAILYSWRIDSPFSTVIGFFTCLFSTLYHLGDTIDDRFGGMNEGNWHRLDNVFAILSFVGIFLYIMDCSLSHETRQEIRTLFVLFTVLLQEMAPWNIECTLIPIALAFLAFWFYLYKHPAVRLALWKGGPDRLFTKGFMLAALGIVGFIKGLNEDEDYLRIAHGCWHFFTGLSFLYMIAGFHQIVSRFESVKE